MCWFCTHLGNTQLSLDKKSGNNVLTAEIQNQASAVKVGCRREVQPCLSCRCQGLGDVWLVATATLRQAQISVQANAWFGLWAQLLCCCRSLFPVQWLNTPSLTQVFPPDFRGWIFTSFKIFSLTLAPLLLNHLT